jgi:tetratricopeptide (TPR) repeat protein
MPEPRLSYAGWLALTDRDDEAAEQLKLVVSRFPDNGRARQMLLTLYWKDGDEASLHELARQTLRLFPSDPDTLEILSRKPAPRRSQPEAGALTADDFLNKSVTLSMVGKFAECVAAAQQALRLNPKSAMAWNNIASCRNSAKEFQEAAQAAREALKLDPTLNLAKKNLAWAEARMK